MLEIEFILLIAKFFREIEELEERKDFVDPITHLVLQCGVGGFASAGAAYAYWNCPRWNKNKVTM